MRAAASASGASEDETARGARPGPSSRQDLASCYACMRCCEVPWPRMALMRSTSLRGLKGLVM